MNYSSLLVLCSRSHICIHLLYSFPIAVVRNYHKLSGLPFITLYFYMSKVQNQPHWAKVRVLTELFFLEQLLEAV